jgi:glyoxylase-like metal-dependent hydrolase (beta-lactamase superfamily II)
MAGFVIKPLHVGTVIRDKSVLTYLKNMGQQIEVPLIAWLIQGNGRRILVDTGGHDPRESEMHGPYLRTSLQHPVAALKEHGFTPDQIDTIIITHLHWDHASNINLFPNAKVFVQQEELKYASSPLPPHQWAYHIHPRFEGAMDQYEIIDGDFEIEKGITAHLTPGHTPGLQGVSVRAKNHIYFIAGDNIPLSEMWNAENKYGSAHWPSPIYVNLEMYLESLTRIESFGDFILPSHDPEVLKHREYS